MALFFMSFSIFCKSQNIDSIYSYMNNQLPTLDLRSSNWGMFFLETPYPIDSILCEKIKTHHYQNTPLEIREEFYKKCIRGINKIPQNNFLWSQEKMKNYIIVKDTRHKINIGLVSKFSLNKGEKKNMVYWINEWNKSKPGDRLVNYSSIPIFSNDKKFVLIVKGQDTENEGGWDTIFIYKLNGDKWEILEKIIISTI